MKRAYYSKLAAGNIIKNRRLYVPNILAGAGLLAMFYIMETLSTDDRLICVPGGSYLTYILPLGSFVIMLLAVILLLYTNSYIMKQRGREFGLYNVLGMEKMHISKILFWESAISAAAVIVLGLAAGMALYRLAALLICGILGVESVLGISVIRLKSIGIASLYFILLYLLGFVINCVRIARMKPVELLHSGTSGEREPKIKWLLLVVGVVTLGAGYYLALTTGSPMEAITNFFIAVILVIIGTYCLFVTGTIAVLKLLKNNSRYYYKKNHMIAVSGLLYRMKQNAVGLASITILATMVIVTVTSTVSLYAGTNDMIAAQFPYDGYAGFHVYDLEAETEENAPFDVATDMVLRAGENSGLAISQSVTQEYLLTAFGIENGVLTADINEMSNIYNTAEFFILTPEEYEKHTGEHLELGENELAAFNHRANSRKFPAQISILGESYTAQTLTSFPISMEGYTVVDCFGLVVSNSLFEALDEYQRETYGNSASNITQLVLFNFADSAAAEKNYGDFKAELYRLMAEYFKNIYDKDSGHTYGSTLGIRWEVYHDLMGMYGTLLFLGLLLSTVFLFTTALIIYYKQISEGYEDAGRYKIMQKVGMSPDEIKGTIRHQIVLVFFLPLIVAAIHTAFASPVLLKLLKILYLTNKTLYIGCTCATVAVFALIYVLIYSVTAKVYYHIVK